MTDSQPIAQLLGALHAARGRTVTTDQLRRKVPAYRSGDLGRRRFQRDLNVLKTRGLIETTVTDPVAGNRDGVRLVTCEKPYYLHLTTTEHAILTRARGEFRRGTPTVSPLPDGPDSPQSRALDELARLLRVVEEHGAAQGEAQADPIRIAELAVLLGVTRDRIVELVREADDLRDTGLFPGLIVTYGDDTDTDEIGEELAAGNDDIVAVAIIRTKSRPRPNPNLGLGLDELGRFGYNRKECDDRIQLLRDAMTAWGSGDPDYYDADSALNKLGGWRDSLPRADEPTATTEPPSARLDLSFLDELDL